MKYNYSAGEEYAKQCGLSWKPEWVTEFDQMAAAHDFTQAQVDVAVHLYLWQLATRIFNVKSYSLKERFMLAFYFLTGCGVKK